MEASSNWRIPKEEPSSDWRSQVQPEARDRIVNRIMNTLKTLLPISRPNGITELKKMAVGIEERIYNIATSQPDYLRKLAMEMLLMEQKTQGDTPSYQLASNTTLAGQSSAETDECSTNKFVEGLDGGEQQLEATTGDASGFISGAEEPFSEWRSQLQPEARSRIVNEILDVLKRHLQISGPDGIAELKKIMVRFEEKIYSDAISLLDYLRKISMKMHLMEQKIEGNVPSDQLPSNTTLADQSFANVMLN